MIKKLIGILLIFLMLFALIVVSLSVLRGYTSTGIGLLDSLLPWEIEGEVDDEGIVNTFYSFIESYDECKQNNKERCFCDTSLELSPNYVLNINTENIKLIREKNELITEKRDLTCILDFKRDKFSMIRREEPLVMRFDEQEPYFIFFLGPLSFYSNYPILYKFNKDEICWVTERVKEDYLKEIKQC